MKKLSALIALMLCVTIGGVYAAWTYAGTDDIADAFAETKVTIADTELVGANGVYKIESNLVLTVDQANEHHEAKLVFSANDSQDIHLTITFTPANHAPDNIKEEALPSEFYFTTTNEMKYDGIDIFTFTNEPDGYFSPNVTWTKQGDGSFIYKIGETELSSMISLSKTFVLDIKAEHDAFREALTGNIVARVTDGTIDGSKLPPKAAD